MTIGSSYNYPSFIAKQATRTKRSTNNKWAARFPNPPDLCFDYRTLVEQENGIARRLTITKFALSVQALPV